MTVARRSSPVVRAGLLVSIVVTVAIALAACVQGGPMPTPTVSVSGSATPTAAPDPVLDLSGTAGQNKAYFDFVTNRFLASGAPVNGRALIDNLVSAGFDKKAMEVTPDRTSANLQADNVEFSVRINGTCLVGQWGNIGFASTAQKLLASGKCLIGTTRTIDW